MKNFALIGAAGYISERHVKAIKDLDCDLKFITDPSDTVGFIDKYFPNSKYFKEIERFDRNIDRLKGTKNAIDFLSICSPNYLHDAHIRIGLRNNCEVICEKPLVIKKSHVILLTEIELQTGKKINSILQLRLHEEIIKLKDRVKNNSDYHNVNLKYITPRGSWYNYSWKGDPDKSGGVLFNIGIHFFDMLIWVFGKPKGYDIIDKTKNKVRGIVHLERAKVEFYLSIDPEDLPSNLWEPYRMFKINNEEFEFSKGFTDLHTLSYQKILNGEGFGIKDVLPAIELIDKMTYE